MPKMLSVREVADLIGCSVSSVRRLESRGRLPRSVRLSYRLKRWPETAIVAWMESLSK